MNSYPPPLLCKKHRKCDHHYAGVISEGDWCFTVGILLYLSVFLEYGAANITYIKNCF